jgi:hypothetical protein
MIFLSPFILNAFLIIIVDPYNFYNVSHIVPDENKKACIGRTMESTPRGNICWKLLEYERNPLENILIGDSRMVHIHDSISENILGEKVYNFSVPGANFITLKDIFWEAVENKNIKNIYIQISFLNFSKNVNYDLKANLDKFRSSPLKYLYDKDIISDTWTNIYYLASKNPKIVDINYRERNVDSWERARIMSVRRLERYDYSEEFEQELNKISRYCKDNKINLYYILIPNHVGFNELVEEMGAEDEYQTFINFVHSQGETINLKTLQQISSNDNNFKDYFHFEPAILDSLTKMIWKEVKQRKSEVYDISD